MLASKCIEFRWNIIVLLTVSVAGFTSEVSSMTVKRQVEFPSYQCKSGMTIDRYLECDGTKHCDDGSDEIFGLCYKMDCPVGTFQCAYGACVNSKKVCDGRRDCADNSDETLMRCPGYEWANQKNHNCNIDEFQCKSGQCISKFTECDGIPHCEDGSDESITVCHGFLCNSFQCAYGGCVHRFAKCNGSNECADGSDEDEELCRGTVGSTVNKVPVTTLVTQPPTFPTLPIPISRPTIAPPPFTGNNARACVIPSHKGTSYCVVNGNTCSRVPANSKVDQYKEIQIECAEGFTHVSEERKNAICLGKDWDPRNITCLPICPPILDEAAVCTYHGVHSKCNKVAYEGTEAKCPENYDQVITDNEFIVNNYSNKCKKGNWEYKMKCRPNCGVLNEQNQQPLLNNGDNAAINSYPWLAAIYRKKENNFWQFRCVGTLISPYAVITAGKCFGDGTDKGNFKVVFRKSVRNYHHEDPNKQDYDVENIYLHPNLETSRDAYDVAIIEINMINYNAGLMPACLLRHFSVPNSVGTFVAYKSGGRNDILPLQETKLNYLDTETCRNELTTKKSSLLQQHFCGGLTSGKPTYSNTDFGSGITFEVNGRHTLFGIFVKVYDKFPAFIDLSHIDISRFVNKILADIRTIKNQ